MDCLGSVRSSQPIEDEASSGRDVLGGRRLVDQSGAGVLRGTFGVRGVVEPEGPGAMVGSQGDIGDLRVARER